MSEKKADFRVAATEDLAWEAECMQVFREACSNDENGLEAYYRTLIVDHFDPGSRMKYLAWENADSKM